ncbi:MAG: hypothetical protein DWQ04_01025 [Chloroflexi bacterium]|nr:MAG: hypothetical protein DWQ04_01025 [Chloroflexota bacterium]
MREALLDPPRHFLSSAFAGLLVYYLTWTMCWYCWQKIYPSHSTTSHDTQAGRYIGLFSWLAALSASFAAHIYFDFIGHF